MDIFKVKLKDDDTAWLDKNEPTLVKARFVGSDFESAEAMLKEMGCQYPEYREVDESVTSGGTLRSFEMTRSFLMALRLAAHVRSMDGIPPAFGE